MIPSGVVATPRWDADFADLRRTGESLRRSLSVRPIPSSYRYATSLEEARWQQVTALLLKAAEHGGPSRFGLLAGTAGVSGVGPAP